MSKQHTEFLRINGARRARLAAQRAAANALATTPVPQAPPFTPNKLDMFKQRRLDEELVRQRRVLEVFYKPTRKRLPLPTTGIFACENIADEDAARTEQIRPRVMQP